MKIRVIFNPGRLLGRSVLHFRVAMRKADREAKTLTDDQRCRYLLAPRIGNAEARRCDSAQRASQDRGALWVLLLCGAVKLAEKRAQRVY